MGLERLVLTFKGGEIVFHTLYRTQDGANPGTVRRRRQVEDLTREGLRQALVSLDGDAALVGCSGFTQREDVLLVDAREEGSAA
jgi:hypothetical protein